MIHLLRAVLGKVRPRTIRDRSASRILLGSPADRITEERHAPVPVRWVKPPPKR